MNDSTSRADTFRLVVSYGTAAVVVLGALAGIFWLMAIDKLDVGAGMAAVTLLAGGAAGFIFVQEAGKQAERAAARATEGVASAAERVAAVGTGAAVGNGSGTTTTTTVHTPAAPAATTPCTVTGCTQGLGHTGDHRDASGSVIP